MRIVSLVPSLTEFIIDMGLLDAIAGRTRFCVHPKPEVESIPVIGGTKNPDIDQIIALNPDIIVANKEENRQEDIEALRNSEADIILTDIISIEDALLAMHDIGKKLDITAKTETLIEGILQKLEDRPDEPPLQTAYFIWLNPLMTVGKNTYIHDVLQHWNLTNVFSYQDRYPEVSFEHLPLLEPELILLSSEPFPFKQKHCTPFNEAWPHADVQLVDGTWFSWYGSRMLTSFDALNTWRRKLAQSVA